MRIALISYEYPPDTGFGGIGTYTYQAAHMLSSIGCYIEVFAGSTGFQGARLEEGILVNRLSSIDLFEKYVHETLKDRASDFDIVEVPEFKACGLQLAKWRERPFALVTKLHTPSYFFEKYFKRSVRNLDKFRYLIGSIIRLRTPRRYWAKKKYSYLDDSEYLQAVLSDAILTPSKDLGEIVKGDWNINQKIIHLNYPFIPSEALLSLAAKTYENNKLIISFIGRLEYRKGIDDLIWAIPHLLKRFPYVKFNFIGAYNNPSPKAGISYKEYIDRKLRKYKNSIYLTGMLPYKQIVNKIDESDILIFPSIWENFPNVCLEAMAGAKAVIGSYAGGMAEMIKDGENGLLISPRKPKDIINAVTYLIENPLKRVDYGINAREKVLSSYNLNIIGKQTIEIYQNVIDNKEQIISQLQN